jgi:hypothetical protein
MARGVAQYSLLGLAVVFVLLIALLPLTQKILGRYAPSRSGLAGFMDMSCKDYATPCPEGYFCQQEKCTSIYPRV